jgi:hypothetical protein
MAFEIIEQWANAITEFEGWYPGSRSFRNNNPGNLRYIRQNGAHNDGGGYAKFNSYEQGWNALMTMLANAAAGKSKVYQPSMTLVHFFQVYAPSADGNHPIEYAKFVAKRLDVDPFRTKIGTFL